MRIIKIVFIIFAFMATSITTAVAQKNYTKEADDAFRFEKYAVASQMYKKAFSKVKNKVERKRILFQMGECARLTKDPKNAESYYNKAIKAKFSDPIVYLYLAESMRDLEKYEEAIAQFKEYVDKVPNDPRGKLGLESCKNALEWIKPDKKTRYEVENLTKINSKDEDFSPAYADKKYASITFTSSRKEAETDFDENTGWAFSSIFVTEQDKRGNWSKPVLIDPDKMINSNANNGGATFNRKFNTMYFTRCPVAKKEIHGCGIYTSDKKGQVWSEPEKLEIANDSLKIGHPAVTRNEKVIYFASALTNGYGGRDIWMAERKKKNKGFDKPVNLGSAINSSGNELYPTIRELEDGTTYLYFSSDGRGGMGCLDIYRSELVDGKWTEAKNLGFPLNSAGDDFGIIFSEARELKKIVPATRSEIICDEMGYLTSDRKGGKGGTDIYEFWLPEIVYTLAGVIRDEATLQFLSNSNITLSGSDGTVLSTKTDAKGAYSFNKKQILKSTTYTLNVTHTGYFSETGTTTTVGLKKSEDLILNLNLTPIPPKPIPLPEIQYLLADWKLQPQFQDSLNGLIETMKKNPTIVIELAAHTDFRDESIKNDTLSQRRAQSVVDYLRTKGIESDRMIPKGYGERVPRLLTDGITFTEGKYKGVSFPAGTVLSEDYITNILKSDKEKEAAHQLNRRTEFRILRDDYVPKNTNDSISRPMVVVNPDDKTIPYKLINDTIVADCYVNNKTYQFSFVEKEKEVKFSLETVMDLINQHKISKKDFALGEEAFDEEGLVNDNAEFSIARMRIGTITIFDVTVKCVRNQKAGIILGKTAMDEYGTYTIDKNKKIITLE